MSLPTIEYLYITNDCLREWNSGVNPGFRILNPVPALRFLYELCMAMLRGELPLQKFKAALGSVVFSDKVSDEELGSQLADIVTQMALDITMSGEVRSRLMKMAKWLVESSLVPLRLFQERCEEDFLWDTEMIKIKAQDLKSKVVRINTRLLYQQTKFNLLREESEGYAKLITLLCRDSGSGANNASSATIGIIKSLIGHFDLDPNRVCDIVLECFELQPDNKVFLDLIPIFPKSHASQILGFKFQYYQRIDVNDPVPFTLYRLTALLVKGRFIDLDSIHAHLLPKDDEAFEHYNVFSAKRLDEANKIGKINLAATGKDLMDDEKQGDVTVDLYAAVDIENEAVVERSSELENNQSLGLLSGFLSVDDWYHAHILLDRLSPLNPVAHNQICSGLFRLIKKSISSVFAFVHPTNLHHFGLSSSETFIDSTVTNSSVPKSAICLPKELFEMLSATGPYLYRDALLLQKVCRVLRGYFLSALEFLDGGCGPAYPEFSVIADRNPRMHMKEVRSRIEEALGSCLLPSLQLIPANPAAGHGIWEVMNLLPYEVRYRLYGEWERDDERVPMVLAARQIAKLDTRRILKRLAKENLKQLGRMIAKLAHANPMTVLRTIVHQIEAYKDMIIPVVDAFKYLTQLEYDVLEYVVIERLVQGGRERLKDDGINLSDWLQSLASFWGHLCKKYPSMELRGLFQYLVNQLKKGNGIELVLLQELIQQMANVQYTENMTEEQLDAMAGSETLRCQATSFGITRNNKALNKSTNRLRDSLLPKDEQKLAVPLLLLIAQHHSVVLVNADAPYIKMVSEQFDRCHGTLLQYVEFLCSAVTPATAYAELLPSLDELVHRYHIDPEVAFLIYRPVLRQFRCLKSDVFWPLDDNDSTNKSMLQNESGPMDLSGTMLLDFDSPPKPVLRSQLLDTVRSMLPSKAWNSLSPELYLTFWGLTLYDLYVPRIRYESEIGKLHAALKSLEELTDNSNSAITKRKKDKERIQDSLDRLTDELQKHEQNVASVHRRLSREKDQWLSSCPDTLKINMEFLQRCIFPRCTFSMPDAIYCAMFVHTLHSLGTPFFNTVNHMDVLICKTLQPMICCCTEYEVGRLGRFLFETLKIAYHWKSDELIYERECGNMPGFAVYYRYPNSQRVAYGQFIKVHWKWSQRITRLLIQCLESSEYMEIRNSLIMLTKIASVFPVTQKSGINLEKRVAKIKCDEREDLKVLATGVAAALAARKSSWVSEEEFGMGYLDLRPAPSLPTRPIVTTQNGSGMNISPGEHVGGRLSGLTSQHLDSGNSQKELRSKPADGRLERMGSVSILKIDSGNVKLKSGSLANGVDVQALLPASTTIHSRPLISLDSSKQVNDFVSKTVDDNQSKITLKSPAESESSAPIKRSLLSGSSVKLPKPEVSKDDYKLGKNGCRPSSNSSVLDRDSSNPPAAVTTPHISSSTTSGNTVKVLSTRTTLETPSSLKDESAEPVPTGSSSFRHDNTLSVLRNDEKQQKSSSPGEDPNRLIKRRKGEPDARDGDASSNHAENDRSGNEEQSKMERSKDKGNIERHERSYRERGDYGDDAPEKSVGDRVFVDRVGERYRDERNNNKVRYNEMDGKSQCDDRFRGQSLPPPPPLPPNVVPQSAGRRDEDDNNNRRFASTGRHTPRLSPRHEDKERRRSEDNPLPLPDDMKRRRDDDSRDKKRDERDSVLIKAEERERERERETEATLVAGPKRRKLKREYLTSVEPGEYSPAIAPSGAINVSQSPFERKVAVVQRAAYLEEPSSRIHAKEVPTRIQRRDIDASYEREWDDEKRQQQQQQRAESKRRHRK